MNCQLALKALQMCLLGTSCSMRGLQTKIVIIRTGGLCARKTNYALHLVLITVRLSRNLSDNERNQRLHSADCGFTVAAFANRARSAFYADINAARPLATHAAWENFAIHTPKAASIWKARLSGIEFAQIQSVLNRVPTSRMSAISREFTAKLLSSNLNRILEGVSP